MGRRRKKNNYHALQQDEEPPEQQPRGAKQQRRGANKRKINKRNFLGGGDENFRRMLEEDGTKTIVDMAPDGNCLFRSLSDQLAWDYGDNHEEVRSDTCDFLEIHEEEFSAFLVLDENEDDEDAADFESYISAMRDSGEWGGNLELVAAARLYRRNVKVFSLAAAYTIEHGEKASTGPDLMISYHDNDHYNSLRDSKAKKPPCKPVKIMPLGPESTSITTTKIEEESTSSESKTTSGTSTTTEEDHDEDSAITLSKRGRRKAKKSLPKKKTASTGKALPQNQPAGKRKSKMVGETPTNKNLAKDNEKSIKAVAAADKMEADSSSLASKKTTTRGRQRSVERRKKQLAVAEHTQKPIEISVKMDVSPSLATSKKTTRRKNSVGRKKQLAVKADTEQIPEPIEISVKMDVDSLLVSKKITRGRQKSVERGKKPLAVKVESTEQIPEPIEISVKMDVDPSLPSKKTTRRKSSVGRKQQLAVKADMEQSPEPIEIPVKMDVDPPQPSKKTTRRKSSVGRKKKLPANADTEQVQKPIEIPVKMDVDPTPASKKLTKRKSSVERKKEWATKTNTDQAQQPTETALKTDVDDEKPVKMSTSEPANANTMQTEKAVVESSGKVYGASIVGEDETTSADLTNALMVKMALEAYTKQAQTLLVESPVKMDTDSMVGEEVETGESTELMEAYTRQAQDMFIAEMDMDSMQDEEAEKEARNGLVLLADTALTQERMELFNAEFDPNFDEMAVSMEIKGLTESDELASDSGEPSREPDSSMIFGLSVYGKSDGGKSKTVSEREATSKGPYVESAGNDKALEPGSPSSQKPAAKRKGKRGGPCHCGSGNTYRKCCKEKEKKQRAALRRASSSIVTDDDDESQQSKEYEMENGFRVLKI